MMDSKHKNAIAQNDKAAKSQKAIGSRDKVMQEELGIFCWFFVVVALEAAATIGALGLVTGLLVA